jgi:hypothetical protein
MFFFSVLDEEDCLFLPKCICIDHNEQVSFGWLWRERNVGWGVSMVRGTTLQ